MRTYWPINVAILATVLIAVSGWTDACQARTTARQQVDAEVQGANEETDRIGYLVRVSLPIDSQVSGEVRQTLKQLAEKSPALVRGEDQTVVVLEFETMSGKTGRGSELESCMSLARYLGDPDLNRLHTVAYIPASEKVSADDDPTLSGQLSGHAVLVAIAANEIAIGPNTAIGNAGIDETQIKPLFRDVYRNVAEQRFTYPVPLVMSMLDRDRPLFRVISNQRGALFVSGEEREKLEASGESSGSTTISSQGEFALLTGRQLADFGLVNLTPSSRTELARELDLAPNSLEGNPAQGASWKALQLDLPPVIDARTSKWIVNSLKQQVGRNGVNLVILNLESNTGDVDACLRVARQLAEYDPSKTRTVAFVRDQAQGPVGLIALACSHLIMAPDAILGGQNGFDSADQSPQFDDQELADLRQDVKSLAAEKQTDWSMLMQMLDPALSVTRYRHIDSGQIRLLSTEEFQASEEPEKWTTQGTIGGLAGVDALTAERNNLARTIAKDMGQIQTFYQLAEEPTSMRPSATARWVERLAKFLSSPMVSPFLIFAAMLFLSTEMSAPGLGLPGFLAAVCFILFFWSQALDGNADWLEIIMFVVGLIFIGLEVFVLPGFGVFGIGGIMLVVTSLVLASQSFLFPKSPSELVQMSYSLLPVIGAGFGVITGAIALRRIIPHSPYLRGMILMPREHVDTGLGGRSDPEAVVDWSYLNGLSGETMTRLVPSGKARIGGKVYDVISKGRMVSKGEPIIVIEAIGNRIVVAAANQDE